MDVLFEILRKEAQQPYLHVQACQRELPSCEYEIWYNAAEPAAVFVSEQPSKQAHVLLSRLFGDCEYSSSRPDSDDWWVCLRRNKVATVGKHLKTARSPLLKDLLGAAQYGPGKQHPQKVPEGLQLGNPVVRGLLAGGTMGALGGYGAGSLLTDFLPDNWNKKRLRTATTVLGGLLGAAPGLYAMTGNLTAGRNLLNPQMIMPKAASSTGFDVPSFGNPINVDNLHNSVWFDPAVRNHLSPQVAGATSGLLNATWQSSGQARTPQGTRLVYPSDVARMALGMGSGYLSGAIVGGILGGLTGMPAETQRRLKQTGMWSGVLANTVPLLFR